MTLHRNAKTCPNSRLLLCRRVLDEGWLIRDAAAAAGLSERRAGAWLRRFRAEGEAGLQDRPSAPRRIPHRTSPERQEAIVALRGLRFSAAEIAETLGMAHSTVSAVLKRCGKGRLPRIAEAGENRYERSRAGELIHIDVKKLGRIGRVGHRVHGDRTIRSRGIGWEFLHVCIDDATRLAYAEVLDDERPGTCIGFLRRAVGWLASHGVTVERVMTDNGNPHRSHAPANRGLSPAHKREGRAPDPHARRWLGLPRGLSLKPRAHRRFARFSRVLQLPPPTPSAGRQVADSKAHRTNQPGWCLHLGRSLPEGK